MNVAVAAAGRDDATGPGNDADLPRTCSAVVRAACVTAIRRAGAKYAVCNGPRTTVFARCGDRKKLEQESVVRIETAKTLMSTRKPSLEVAPATFARPRVTLFAAKKETFLSSCHCER